MKKFRFTLFAYLERRLAVRLQPQMHQITNFEMPLNPVLICILLLLVLGNAFTISLLCCNKSGALGTLLSAKTRSKILGGSYPYSAVMSPFLLALEFERLAYHCDPHRLIIVNILYRVFCVSDLAWEGLVFSTIQ